VSTQCEPDSCHCWYVGCRCQHQLAAHHSSNRWRCCSRGLRAWSRTSSSWHQRCLASLPTALHSTPRPFSLARRAQQQQVLLFAWARQAPWACQTRPQAAVRGQQQQQARQAAAGAHQLAASSAAMGVQPRPALALQQQKHAAAAGWAVATVLQLASELKRGLVLVCHTPPSSGSRQSSCRPRWTASGGNGGGGHAQCCRPQAGA
jgi:hypothetical protein